MSEQANWSSVLGEESARGGSVSGLNELDQIDLTFSPDEEKKVEVAGPATMGAAVGKVDDQTKKSALIDLSQKSDMSSGSAPDSAKTKCDACGRSIRKDQLAHTKSCPCRKLTFHAHEKGGKNCCFGANSLGSELAKSMGYTRSDGGGHLEHPDVRERLRNPTPFSLEDPTRIS
eukprot:3237042-Rhodomonas_salina.1